MFAQAVYEPDVALPSSVIRKAARRRTDVPGPT